ncbi:unnamed protein product [Phytomonas sp. Hart1]|nr:unnamed protein product [Phytomonas sp. Hart1]|eukprot:CCW65919.1 unnamed protein product [Phytomonas sp. isolate Hart1]
MSLRNSSESQDKANAAARLQKELMELILTDVDGISAFPHNDDLFHWVATVSGVERTPYEGLEYRLSMNFPSNYPYSAPTVNFLTPCFHPNVDVHGVICLDILKERWSAAYTAGAVLLSVQSLLDNPNNQSPLNAQAAQMWGQTEGYRRAVLATYETGSIAHNGGAP